MQIISTFFFFTPLFDSFFIKHVSTCFHQTQPDLLHLFANKTNPAWRLRWPACCAMTIAKTTVLT